MADIVVARRDFVQMAALGTASTVAPQALAALADARANVTPQLSPKPTAGATTADIVVETLIAWGAPFVFGIVGDGINPIRGFSNKLTMDGIPEYLMRGRPLQSISETP
jgi:hypothetical protein